MASKSKPMDAQWEPVKGKPTTLDRIQACAKSVCLYATINLVLFYWQQSGLLADKAATPAMWVCALLAGYQLGKCIARGYQDV